MLDINKISHVAVFDEQWRAARRGKITGSPVGLLMSENSHLGIFTKQGLTYLQGLAGEIITGMDAKQEFFTDATNHGNATEPEAIEIACQQLGKVALRNDDRADTHRLIINDELTAVTPDALIATHSDINKLFDETGTKLKVYTMETKCPMAHHRFIKLYECLTPADIKKAEPLYYWQKIAQVVWCDVLMGYFVIYSPYFRKIRIIEFKKMDLLSDIKKFNQTIEHAKSKLQEYINLLK